uniref:Inosine/uridine-preferring nucleoside hydrolase domain-containing protein n=1 Tax=Pseudictyota dubia TaxID=2749911 RepID=A0A7R9WKN7_9STRA
MMFQGDTTEDATAVIPRELSNIVLAAFNNLSPILWDALKIASCIGYSFDADVYEALTGKLGFIPKVEELATSYDAFERSDSNRYKWKHQAVYEAVKSLLLKNQCVQIHSMIIDVFDQSAEQQSEGSENWTQGLKADAHRLLARHCSLAEKWDGAFQQYMNAGRRAEETYNFNEATKMYEEAIVCLGKITPQHSMRSRLLPTLRLGSCLRELARYNDSEAVLTQCLSETEAELAGGKGDEQMYVHALTALATLHQYQSKYNEARDLYERALPIARRVEESSSSLWLAGHIAGYAEILRKSGDLPSAERLHREALEMRKERSCTELEMAVSYTQLGCTLFGLKRYQEAYKQHRLALLSRFKYLDFSHGLVSESLNYCAEALCALGRSEDGIPLAMHGVEIRKQVFGSSHPALAHAFSILASNYHAVGRSCDAKQLLEKCLAICEEAFPKNHANIIPNLMNYGKVLRSMGNYRKGREVYERSIVIHQLNFKANQKVDQLEKCRLEAKELAQLEASAGDDGSCIPDIARGVMPIPCVNMDLGASPIIILTDVGRDVDDEYALILLGALSRMNLLTPLAVVTTLAPARERASLTRGSLDALGLAKVPVGVGGAGGLDTDIPLEVYGAQYARSCSCIFESGVALMVRALESAPENSVQLLCIASLQDAATLIREHEELFVTKVKEVLIMGGVKPLDSSEFLEPDTAYNNNCDMESAKFVYKRCQEMGVPTLTLTRYTAYGCPVSNVIFDDLVKTAHMVGINTRRVSMEAINRLWHKVNLAATDPRREKLPSRCDRQWFCRTFFGKENIDRDSSMSIWDLVTKLNMYDPLTMLCCVPEYRETYFYWESKCVNGVQHRVTGISEMNNGVIDSALLCKKLYSLFGLSLRNALQNIC